MIFQLAVFELFQVIWAADHMLDQLCDLLIELNHVWFAMDEVLDLLPGGEEVVAFDVALGLAASEAIDDFA